jgi:hypothetical protein
LCGHPQLIVFGGDHRDLLAETAELCWQAACMLPFLRRPHDPLLDDFTAEVPLVEILAKNEAAAKSKDKVE